MTATTYTLNILVTGEDRASGPLSGISGALGNIGQIAGGILAAGAIQRIASGIVDMGRSAIGATANFQSMQIGMEALLARELRTTDSQLSMNQALSQAAPLARNLLGELRNIAITSPYELGTVTDTFRLGMAFGFTADESKKVTRGMLNVAAGVGASNEQLGRMSYNFAQIRMQGRVTATDVRQLAMAGFDLNGVLRAMGDEFGVVIKDHNDFNAAIASGKLSWADFATSFEKYATDNFGGASARMSMTLNGLKSTFNDVFALSMPAILGPAAEIVTGYLQDILGRFIDFTNSGELEKWGRSIADAVQRGADRLEYFFKLVDRVKTFGFDSIKPYAIANLLGIDTGQLSGIVKSIQTAIGAAFAGIGAGGTGIFSGLTVAGLLGPLLSLISGAGPILSTAFGNLLSGALSAGFLVNGGIVGTLFDVLLVSPLAALGSKLGPVFGKILGGAGGLVKFLMPLAPLMGSLVGFLAIGVVALTAFGVAMQALNGNVGFFQGLLAQGMGVLDNFGLFWTQQGPALAAIGQQVFSALAQAGSQLAQAVLPWLMAQFKKISAWFVEKGPLITAFVGVLATFFTDTLLPAIVGFWTVVEPLLTGFIDLVLGVVTAVMQAATGDWAGAWATMQTTVEGVWAALQTAGMNFVNWVLSWIGTDWATVSANWASAWEGMKAWAGNAISGIAALWSTGAAMIVGLVTTFLASLGTLWSAGMSLIGNLVGSFLSTLANMWTTGLGMIVTIAGTVWAAVKALFSGNISEIAGIFSKGASAMKSAGQNMLQGLYDGIAKKATEVLDFVKKIAGDIAQAFAGVMQIKSPSRLFMGYGENIVAGLTQGMQTGEPMAMDASSSLANATMSPFTRAQSGASPDQAKRYGGNSIVINVDGSKDPEVTAKAIFKLLKQQGVVA